MTLRIGRIPAFSEPMSWRNQGDQVEIRGRLGTGSPSAALLLRDQLLGYNNNPDEPVVPIISTTEPGLTGFYRTHSVEVPTTVQMLLAGGELEYIVQAERVDGFRTPSIESTLIGALIPNAGGITNSNAYPWHAVPGVATGYYLPNTGIFVPRTAEDGALSFNISRVGGVAVYNNKARFSLATTDYYKSAAQLLGASAPAVLLNAKDAPTIQSPWVTAADGLATSGTALKLPSGSSGTIKSAFTNDVVLPAGTHRIGFRVRSGTAGGGTNKEVALSLLTAGGAGFVPGWPRYLKPIEARTTYDYFTWNRYVSDGVTPIRFQAIFPGGLTTTVDWFVDIWFTQLLNSVVGQQASPGPASWVVNNGLVRVQSPPRNDGLQIEWYDGTKWGPFAHVIRILPLNAAALTENVSGIRILRNSPEEVIVRVMFDPASVGYASHLLDVAVRRGARVVRCYIATVGQVDQWTISDSNEFGAYTTITDGVRYTSNDDDGNRIVIMSATAMTGTANTASALNFDFGIGLEIPGATGTAGNTAQDLIYEYVAGQGERQMVVVR